MPKNSVKENGKLEMASLFVPVGGNKLTEEALNGVRTAMRENKTASVLRALENLRECLRENTGAGVLSADGLALCADPFAMLMIHESEEVAEAAVASLSGLLPFFSRLKVTPAMRQKTISNSKILMERVVKIRDKGVSRWHEICCVWIKVMLNVFLSVKELPSINCILKVVEGGFKHVNLDIRAQSFVCWRVLLETVTGQAEWIGSRIGFLSIPLYYTTSYNNNLAEVKFSTWWYFLCKVKKGITKENTVVVMSFLKFCFEPYTSVLGGRIVSDSITLAPGKKVISLREKVISALVYLLGPAEDVVLKLHQRCGLELAVDTIMNASIYRETESDVIWSCQEATLMLIDLTGIDTVGISKNLWENLSKFFNKENVLRVLKILLDVLEVMMIRCEKDSRITPHLQIIIETLQKLDTPDRFLQEHCFALTEITQQTIDLVINNSMEIREEDAQKIISLVFRLVQRSCNLEMIERICDQIVEIDVRMIKKQSHLQMLIKDYITAVEMLLRSCKYVKKNNTKTALSTKIFKWCLESFKTYSSTAEFINHWTPLREVFDLGTIQKYQRTYNISAKERVKDFFPLFKSLCNGGKNATPIKDDTFVVIPPKTVPVQSYKTNMLTETQKEKMRKRADDIPALYNDLSQSLDSMPVSESLSNSVIEPTPVASVTKWVTRELVRLKTDTVDGHNTVLGPRSSRRKSNPQKEEEPKRILMRRSSVSSTEKTPENVQRMKLRRSSISQERLDDVECNQQPELRFSEVTPPLTKARKTSMDHNYHSLLKTPSPTKGIKNSPTKNGLDSELMNQMFRNVSQESWIRPIPPFEVSEEVPKKMKSPEKAKVSSLKIREFALESSGTQNLFSETQNEPERPVEMALSNADTQVMTQEHSDTLPTSLSVQCNSVETQKSIENTSSTPLTTTFVRVHSVKPSLKPGPAKTIYKVKESPRVELPNAVGMNSPKFSSRAAQMLSMSTASSSTPKKMVTPVKRTPAKVEDTILRFSTTCPSPQVTPCFSILKRKRDNLNDSSDLTAKKRRISFHDPPVTKTKEYILDDAEIALKQHCEKRVDIQHRRNLLMDSPPSPSSEPIEVGENDSDWEDLEEEEERVSDVFQPQIISRPKNRVRKGLRLKEMSNSMVWLSNEALTNGQEEATPETPKQEVDVKKVFSSDEDILNYVWDTLMEKNLDRVIQSSDEVKISILERLMRDRVVTDRLKTMNLEEFCRLIEPS